MSDKQKHSTIREGRRIMWYTERLWELSANFPVKQVALKDIPEFHQNCWFQSRPPTPREIADHTLRINNADLSYPIILNEQGGLMDGGHRMCKAYLQGQSTIAAVQFEQLPEPDAVIPGSFVHLESKRLILREFVAADVEALFELYQLPQTSEFESWDPHDSLEHTRGLLQSWIDESYSKSRMEYTLAVVVAGKMIGLCGIEMGFGTETDDERAGFVGYRLHPDYWGQGYATEAAMRMVQFGFEELGLHRVHSGCSANNSASSRVLEKAGFIREGTTRKSFPIGDSWTDYHIFGQLKEDYLAES